MRGGLVNKTVEVDGKDERWRDREHKWGKGREREKRIPSRLHPISTEPDVELDLTNHEIVT